MSPKDLHQFLARNEPQLIIWYFAIASAMFFIYLIWWIICGEDEELFDEMGAPLVPAVIVCIMWPLIVAISPFVGLCYLAQTVKSKLRR
jgi:branched-subunit amino acid permease